MNHLKVRGTPVARRTLKWNDTGDGVVSRWKSSAYEMNVEACIKMEWG